MVAENYSLYMLSEYYDLISPNFVFIELNNNNYFMYVLDS